MFQAHRSRPSLIFEEQAVKSPINAKNPPRVQANTTEEQSAQPIGKSLYSAVDSLSLFPQEESSKREMRVSSEIACWYRGTTSVVQQTHQNMRAL
jgi:hypothetical protein